MNKTECHAYSVPEHPLSARKVSGRSRGDKRKFSRAAARGRDPLVATRPVAVVAGAAGFRLDLEQDALDRDDAYRVTCRDRCRAVRPRSPQRVADPDDAVGIDTRPPRRPSPRSAPRGRSSASRNGFAPLPSCRTKRTRGLHRTRSTRIHHAGSSAAAPSYSQIEPATSAPPPMNVHGPSPPACRSIGEPEDPEHRAIRPPTARPGDARSRSNRRRARPRRRRPRCRRRR